MHTILLLTVSKKQYQVTSLCESDGSRCISEDGPKKLAMGGGNHYRRNPLNVAKR